MEPDFLLKRPGLPKGVEAIGEVSSDTNPYAGCEMFGRPVVVKLFRTLR